MAEAFEALAIIFALGAPASYLVWGYIPAAAVKAAGATLIALTLGYLVFLATAFVEGVAAALRGQSRD